MKQPTIFTKETWLDYCSRHPELPLWRDGQEAKDWFTMYRVMAVYIANDTDVGYLLCVAYYSEDDTLAAISEEPYRSICFRDDCVASEQVRVLETIDL